MYDVGGAGVVLHVRGRESRLQVRTVLLLLWWRRTLVAGRRRPLLALEETAARCLTGLVMWRWQGITMLLLMAFHEISSVGITRMRSGFASRGTRFPRQLFGGVWPELLRRRW